MQGFLGILVVMFLVCGTAYANHAGFGDNVISLRRVAEAVQAAPAPVEEDIFAVTRAQAEVRKIKTRFLQSIERKKKQLDDPDAIDVALDATIGEFAEVVERLSGQEEAAKVLKERQFSPLIKKHLPDLQKGLAALNSVRAQVREDAIKSAKRKAKGESGIAFDPALVDKIAELKKDLKQGLVKLMGEVKEASKGDPMLRLEE